MAGKEPVELLIENGTVVTVDRERRVIRDGAVAVAGGRIRAVGKAAELRQRYEPRRAYQAARKLVLPGLVNAHIHFYHHMHRGLSPETLNGMGWSDFVHRRVAEAAAL
jgi:5-methylthioadenosine/S-adenosylhomocysteine deaminase